MLDRAADALARQTWLDAVARPLQGGITRAFEAAGAFGRQVKDALHGTWLGHPLHPVLTDIPIGAWSAAAVLDLLEARGHRRAGAGADTAVAVGLAGAAGAAVTGATDWQHTEGGARRIGLVHAALKVAATALYVASYVHRRRGDRDGGRAYAMAGLAMGALSAYLGGRLVFHDRVGVNHAETALPARRDFVAVLADTALPDGHLRRVEVDGVGVLLARHGGRVHALTERCSHLGGPLAQGRLEADAVVCPWHGSRFALADGSVVGGPSTYAQPCFDVRIRNGQIEIRANAAAAALAA